MNEKLDPGVVSGTIRPPGSKSQTIRVLAIAGLAAGESRIDNSLDADDANRAQAMIEGFGVSVQRQGGSRLVSGRDGGLEPPSRSIQSGFSGLTARIALAMSALVDGTVTIDGMGRLRDRPMSGMTGLLREMGLEVSADTLPITVVAKGILPDGHYLVSTAETTQFASALLLVAPYADGSVTVELSGSPGARRYVDLTVETMGVFGANVEATTGGYRVAPTGYQARDISIEPDFSSAVYPMVAAAITGGQVRIPDLRRDSTQPDSMIVDVLEEMGCAIDSGSAGIGIDGPDRLDPIDVDFSDAPDGALAVAVACLFCARRSRLRGLHSLTHKESDRLVVMADRLSRLGAAIDYTDSELVVTPGPYRGAVLGSGGDHRVAMSLALAGLRIPDVEISEPWVVDKTWPDFFEAMRQVIR